MDHTKTRQMALTLDRTRARIAELELQLIDITTTLAELRAIEDEVLAHQTGSSPKSRSADA